ncbi:MAG: hypothetical protein ACK5MF_10060 [Vibrio sp.]|uniref:hypothetical protein n=1 Tax=Vibrio sp. TaxID=678 RepID=UPI003A849DC8
MTKLAIASFVGLLSFHATTFAFTNDQFANNDMALNEQAKVEYNHFSEQKTSGLDISSVAASALVGYLDESSDSDFLPNAAAAIAISAGLQYTVDTQLDSISDMKIAPYFNGSETGITLSFTFQ